MERIVYPATPLQNSSSSSSSSSSPPMMMRRSSSSSSRTTGPTPKTTTMRRQPPLHYRSLCILGAFVAVALLGGGGPPLSAVEGAASAPLLGGQYEPTTDVNFATDLMEILEAISLDPLKESALTKYKLVPPDSPLSLFTIAGPEEMSTDLDIYLDSDTNPLYGIYMHALWRSNHGSGKDRSVDQPRSEMKFLGEKVDYYAHKIVADEFAKSSAYNPELTAETIGSAIVWMAAAQGLYEAVDACDAGGDEADIEDPTWVDPVDIVAALWFGSLDVDPPEEGANATEEGATIVTAVGHGSMYAWTARARSNFDFDDYGATYDVNAVIVSKLKRLKTLMTACLAPNSSGTTGAAMMIGDDVDEDEAHELEMRVLADDIARAMTVPLVQNLIHHAGTVAKSEEAIEESTLDGDVDGDVDKDGDDGGYEVDPNVLDYMILYGLVALPPIAVCDEYAYNDLYAKFVTDAKQFDEDGMYDALNTLYGRLICLGITCDQIGKARVLGGMSVPMCNNPQAELRGYEGSDPDAHLEYMKIDLDVRTIGTLIEVDAHTAAYDVYHWGRHSRPKEPDGTTQYMALQTIALEGYHEKNAVGKSYDKYYLPDTVPVEQGGTSHFADRHEFGAMLGFGRFSDATPTQRRIITEATVVTITLHAFALNCMYMAIDSCNSGDVKDMHWDRAFASISGWAEEAEHASGFLFMEIARYLCSEAGTCNQAGDSEVNRRLIVALESGKNELENFQCDNAEERAKEIEKLLQAILVDATAYFADLISQDPMNVDNLAEGFGVATAVVPLMDEDDADFLERNMGSFGEGNEIPLADGKELIFAALARYTEEAGIDCSLLTMNIGCDYWFGEQPPSVPGATLVTDPGMAEAPTYPPSTYPPSSAANVDPLTPDAGMPDEEYTSLDVGHCHTGTDGGVGSSMTDASVPSDPLLGGAYTPTSNVDHIIELTNYLEDIEGATDKDSGVAYYRKQAEGVSLGCLSTGVEWLEVTTINPLYLISMYGLWSSDVGDNDGDGYSDKLFDDEPILNFGDTIVMDEFKKSSGFDPMLSAETVRVANMWMAATTELYRAAQSCRSGYVDNAPNGFNPVDFAAALWYGNAENPDLTEGGSLYVWAKRISNEFIDQSEGANEEVRIQLVELQQAFAACKGLTLYQQKMKGIQMKHMVDEITRWMLVPMVQYFIHHLATESGIEEKEDDERNYMVLYALITLPFISICNEDMFDDLFNDLVVDIDSYDSATFTEHIKLVYDNFECLGIRCDMVGKSVHAYEVWPECKVPSVENTMIAGYTPTSEATLETLKVDLDISTILSFIVMEAGDAALDIYENGRNAKDDTNSYVSIKTIGIPSSHPDAIAIYNDFHSTSSVDYTSVTKDAIVGEGEFRYSSVLKNSGVASLAIATIDMHMNILDNMYQAVECDETGSKEGWDYHWDQAVASLVGWGESAEDGTVDGYLLYQLAQELCEHFDKCDSDGRPAVNKLLIQEFKKGQESLKENQCEEAKTSKDTIEKYLQAILVDSLAYHSRFADSSQDDRLCLMAYVARNAILPLIRPVDALAAAKIEANVGATASDCHVNNADAVYAALNDFVQAKGIDCSLLVSSVCSGSSTTDTADLENVSEYTVNNLEDDPNTDENERSYLLNNEYEPLADVTELHGISTLVQEICNAGSVATAKFKYTTSEANGMSIKSMSTSAKYAMADEIQFFQYAYALHDDVNKYDGSLVFDDKPATEYAHTITNDAIATSTTLGCRSMKVLNMWMWVVHKLNDAVEACRDTVKTTSSGHLDEAAALWDGSLLFEMAEQLGPKFGNDQIRGLTSLNRQIVDRLKKAREIIFLKKNECSYAEVRDLRIIVKETISFMTAVLIQSFIDSMLDADSALKEKEQTVELMAFAVLPFIKTCGQEAAYDDLYTDLIADGFEPSMVGSTIGILQSHYNCLGLTCGDVGRHNEESDSYPKCSDNLDIIGYTPVNATKTNMVAKLDLDAVAIHQLMSMEKTDLAKKVYLEGHNYFDYDSPDLFGFVSLHNLTQSHTIEYTAFPTYELYKTYLEPDFANKRIIAAFDGTDHFQNSTTTQRDLAVNVAISSLVSYIAALQALYLAASSCSSSKKESETAFDGAVALLAGSVEGRGRGGSIYQEGKMFYGVGKRSCEHFHSCRGGDAEVNVELFRVLTEGQEFIQQDNCEGAAEAVDSIDALLKAPLIQSLLYFSDSTISMNSDDDDAGYVAAMAALPILDDIDPTSADNIRYTMVTSTSSTPESKEDTVISAMGVIFSKPETMEIVDCELVTDFDEICNPSEIDEGDEGDMGDLTTPYSNSSGDSATQGGKDENEVVEPEDDDENEVVEPEDDDENDVIEPEAPMPISNGLYVATNYVGDRSAIAVDVQEIEERFKSNDFDEARHYYTHGVNSKIYNENGIPTGELRSIAGFSLDSGVKMRGDPTYNLFIHGLSDENQEFLGRPASVYADSFILDLLYSELPEAADAMVAITIWMQVAHSLHSAYGACKSSFLADGRTIDGRLLQRNDPALMIDEAAAYWIGDDQSTGSSSRGHLLYALTESMGDEFERHPKGAESAVNSAIIDLFNKAKNHIAISRGCSTSEDSHLKLKGIIDELIPWMAVPLLRSLLYYMSTDEPKRVKVFATAVLPLFSACAPSIYKELKDELIDHDVIEIQKEYIYSKIQSMYSCLGLTCDTIGSMQSDNVLQCNDSSELNSLAGYRFVTDQQTVNTASRVDVEVKKIEILMNNGIYHFPDSTEVLFGTAFDLYKYGQHSSYTRSSLSNLARDTNRDVVPAYATFRRYFNFDGNYADTMIVNAFQKKGIFAKATVSQRKRVIAFSLKYMVTYMTILEKLYSSLRSCNEDKREEGVTNLDLAAGYFVGSLEGKDDGGSFDGDLIFMLAKRMCVHFGTCTQANHASINERIVNLFYAAQGEIETGACTSLERTVKEIENALIVPLIQGVVFSARENLLYFGKAVSTEFYPEGYALAHSILPIINDADPDSARDIENVMVAFFPGSSETDPGANNFVKVHSSLRNALAKMKGVDCSAIGRLSGNPGFCQGDAGYSGLSPASSRSPAVPVVLLASAGIFMFALY